MAPIQKQDYDLYTSEDQAVWKILFTRQLKQLPEAASAAFMEGLEKINFTADKIPNFTETNVLLRELTGWELVVVPGIVDDQIFFELLADKKFPATTWLRKMSELDYLEEPDMFHDVFAHAPLLTNQAFVDFLQALSKIALDYIDSPKAINLLSRVYWYTVEFGLIREHDVLKIYGAGILSSAGETKYSLSTEPKHYEYDVRKVLEAGYAKDKFQLEYYIIPSYEALYGSIPQVKKELANMMEYEKNNA